ncbi:hypothetical protein [Streptomyces sp. NPDC046727]|uniref:hypothetical protein n=1 Tax=Streptomyces sp. NPDC046727 TaxID=3155373 RepID=UPI00340C6FBF
MHGRRPSPAHGRARLLGHVNTGHGVGDRDRTTEGVRRHRTWYAADGCCVDRVTAGPESLPVCRRPGREVRRLGAGTVVLDPDVHPGLGHATTYLSASARPSRNARHPGRVAAAQVEADG